MRKKILNPALGANTGSLLLFDCIIQYNINIIPIIIPKANRKSGADKNQYTMQHKIVLYNI
ncbi:hypothetical protein [Dysgonomonas sp. 521]|uniref:hypothetical protein n=1 Tax=Dysgonomonas sp. 521 TaxID=2302932 RepID=UPI0013D5AFCE|nr:hypothetical protein [Dysgonomonas sp. 521]